jgi:type I restriction enzyme S subunit
MKAFSPVPWQPCTLTDWPATQAKHVFDISLGKMLQPSPSNSADVEAPYIKAVNVQWNGISIEDLPTMWASSGETNALNLKVGDLLVCEGGEVGRASILSNEPPENCIYQNALHRVRSEINDVRYLRYCLKQASEAGWFDVLCNRATIAHFTVEKFRELRIHIPSQRTQRLIADYLDRETVHIDALVAEKEKMLALLEEKRAALISRAVTRGLDPDAPLKPSGLDWLGDIPAHWETTKFSWSVFIAEGQVDPENDSYVEMTLIAPNHIESRTGRILSTETANNQGAISGKYLCREGDVLYSKIRPALRKVTLAQEDCLCSADMYALRPNESLRTGYLLYFLLSEDFSNWAELESARVAMPKINRESLNAIRLPVPPVLEQDTIVNIIKNGTRKIDLQRESIGQTIQLLKERRAALITSAVTGQISPKEMRA